jgi:YNFM family putative membrane transporter
MPFDPAPPEPVKVYIERGSRAFYKTTVALFLSGFATFSLLYCVQPMLPVLAATFHVGAAESSLALSVSSSLLALAVFAASAVSDMVGRKSLMAVSLCIAAGLNVLAACAPTWPLLLAARALEGIALGGAPAVAMAYLAEEIDPRSLGLTMGLYVAGTALGGMSGRVLTGIAADLGGWRVALGVIGAVGLASALGFAALLPPSRNFQHRPGLNAAYHLKAWGGHLRHPGLPWLFAMGFLAMGGFVAVYNYVGFLLTGPRFHLSQTAAGLIFLVYLFGMAASSSAGALADRLGRVGVLAAGVVTFGAGLALTLIPALPALICGIALITMGFFAIHATASGWVGRMAEAAKGHAASLYMLVYYLGASLLGSAGGWFWTKAGWGGVAGFVAALLLAALLVVARLAALTAPGRWAASGSR